MVYGFFMVHDILILILYQTQVNLGSDSWVRMSLTESIRDIVETLLM